MPGPAGTSLYARATRRFRAVIRATRCAAPVLLVAGACMAKQDAKSSIEAMWPDRGPLEELPVMTNIDVPIRYPAALYARRVQGNVLLRLFVDARGRLHPESTRVQESSGIPALDSAAVSGSLHLRFKPARRASSPVGLAFLFPVYFRHPQAPPLPGDSVLRRTPLRPPAP